MFDDQQELAWVAIGLIRNVGARTLRNLQSHFAGDLTRALSADRKTLQQVRGIGAKTATAIQAIDLESIHRDISRWQAENVQIVPLNSPDYPRRLRLLDDAPATVFMRGKYTQEIFDKTVAIVGTRQPDDHIKEMATLCATELAFQGYTIVSGMALGIDTCAHLGTLAIPDTPTIAVLGSGVLKPYPPENAGLARAIMQRSPILSEVRPDATVNAPALVARNRIITGLADKVIVMQSEANGGAMHAARFATAQERTVFTLDAPYSGNQQLLQQETAVALPLNREKAIELIIDA